MPIKGSRTLYHKDHVSESLHVFEKEVLTSEGRGLQLGNGAG
jgi:hypothetical protein